MKTPRLPSPAAVLTRRLVLPTLVLGTLACDPSLSRTSGDPGYFNDDLAAGLGDLRPGIACPRSALVVFVGSSERPAVPEDWHLTAPTEAVVSRDMADKAAAFASEIARASRELANQLEATPRCTAQTKMGHLVFLQILDGDGQGDSRIETTVHQWGPTGAWTASTPRAWRWDASLTLAPSTDGSDDGSEPGATLELDMAFDVGPIVWTVATQSLATLAEPTVSVQRGSDVSFDQILYVVKAHGGKFVTDFSQQPLRDTVPTGASLAGAILFDTRGPSGALASSLYVPRWSETARDDDFESIDDNNPTSGLDDGNPTSGSGIAYLSPRSLSAASSSASGVDGVLALGHAATFSDLGVGISSAAESPGTLRLDLPLGARGHNLLILDACHGTPDAAEAFSAAGELAILYNPNPIYYEYLEYDAMDTTQLLTLPAFLSDLARADAPSDSQRALLEKLRSGTAATDQDDDATNGDSSDSLTEGRYKEHHIWTRSTP